MSSQAQFDANRENTQKSPDLVTDDARPLLPGTARLTGSMETKPSVPSLIAWRNTNGCAATRYESHLRPAFCGADAYVCRLDNRVETTSN